MVLKTDFSTSAFGGFKKEEVTNYIKSLSRDYEDEIAILNDNLEHTNAQLTEFKDIVEEQYSKIVDVSAQEQTATDELTKLKVENEEHLAEIQRLNDSLIAVSAELKHTSSEKRQLLEDNSHIDESFRSLKSQIPCYLQEINDLKAQLAVFLNAQADSDKIVISAKEQAQQILNDARTQIEQTISLSEENQERARKLYDIAALEADEIVRKATENANAEKGQYESCLRALERQKAKLLEALDCIKSEVSTIKIGVQPTQSAQFAQPEKPEKPLSQKPSMPQSFRGKYTSPNRERFSGKPRY